MTLSARPAIRNRLVVHIHGYQLTAPERFHRRFGRDLATFGKTWTLATGTGPAEVRTRQARWPAETAGPGWRTRTDYRIIRVDDIIALRHRQPMAKRVATGLAGLFDFLLGPALIGYFRYGWRYAIFALAPLAMILASLAAGVVAGRALSDHAGAALGLLAGLAVFAAAIAVFVKRYYLFILLEDWAFASVLARRLEPELAARLQDGAGEVRAALAEGAYDEVVLIGHSLGAVLILHLAEMLLAEPLPKTESRLAILTIGSSVLKIALHGAAHPLRRATETVTACPSLVWADYWSHHDVMSFPYADPAESMGVTALYPPISRKATFRQMLEPEALRALRFDFFRKHNQFFHAATRRAAYDYFMFTCGPFPCADLVRSQDGAIPWLDEAGAFTASAPVTRMDDGAAGPSRQQIA